MRAQTAKTTLTAYFSAVEEELTKPLSENELGADIIGSVYPRATALTYQEFRAFYTWNSSNKKWSR